jgi:patatin-like phospholipase/acyl hydrolase
MSMLPLRDNVAIAIDGGGIKGLIISKGLSRIESELGGIPLIKQSGIKVLAGTSTGSLISMGLAIGMTADQIANIYVQFGQDVFPPLSPVWLPDFVRKGYEMFLMVTRHSLYTTDKLKQFLRNVVAEHTGNPDLTLGELKQRLAPGQAVIFTTVNITQRRTRFIKSYQDKWADWKVWEAALASSCAPVALPVYARQEGGQVVYYTDGGVGSYGNPAYVATEEIITYLHHDPKDVTVLSFGTGWIDETNYVAAVGKPTNWAGLDWAMNAPLVVTADATRTQSIDILDEYGKTIDFRRFQFALVKDITSDAYADQATYNQMIQLGEALGENIVNNNYAPKEPMFDPEGIREAFDSFHRAQREKE